jgi:hypothetical protein
MKFRNLFCFLVGILLVGCSYIQSNPPSGRDSICADLKRQLIFNKTDLGSNYRKSSAVEQVQLMQLYKQYECDAPK